MKKKFEFENLKNNFQFKKGVELGKLYADQLEKKDPKKYEEIKSILIKLTGGK